MALATQLDSFESESLLWPYEPNIGRLSGSRVFVDGSNTFIGWDEVLRKRPPVRPINSVTPVTLATKEPVRSWVYRTLEATPYTFVVISFYNPSTTFYELYYSRIDAAPDALTQVSERRDCNHSRYPHTGVEYQGKFYIKSYPNEMAGDRLGSIVLDGTGGTIAVHDWGMLGPTVPTAVSSPAGWGASTHSVTVRTGWKYSYTWVNTAGHESTRAPLQTNPDEDPSDTGAFTNKVPALDVVGPADTTEYPYINIYRTQDGGGTFYFLEQIANTGGTINYLDDSLESGAGGGTFDDPIPDDVINTLLKAPSETSNTPPPTVRPPDITGTDTIQNSTNMKVYANRVWFAIDEYLFYSANEELNAGVPVQAWPSGDASPNFFRFKEKIVDLITTPDALIIIGASSSYKIRGTTKQTFNPSDFLPGIGGLNSMFADRIAIEAGDYAIWVTQDFRVVAVAGDSYEILTDSLGDNLFDAVVAGSVDALAKVTLAYVQLRNREILVVSVRPDVTDGESESTWWVMDFTLAKRIKRAFWHTPWSMYQGTFAFGPGDAESSSFTFYFTAFDGSNTELGFIDFDSTAGDLDPSSSSNVAYGASFTTALQTAPEGNHLNANSSTGLEEMFQAFVLTRTKTSGDTEPTVVAYLDNFYTSETALVSELHPPRRYQASDYNELWYQKFLSKVAKYVAVKVTIPTDTYTAEIHRMAFVWQPNAGS